MKILFALLGSGLFAAAILLGGSFASFVNLPSAIIVIGGMVCFSLAHHDAADFKAAIQSALGNEPSQSLQKEISVLGTLRKTTYGSGIAGSLIGLVQMLQNLEDPSAIGPAMAVALLTVFYSIMIVEFLIDPLINRILSRAKINAQSAPISPSPQSGHPGGIIVSAVLCVFVLLIAFQ